MYTLQLTIVRTQWVIVCSVLNQTENGWQPGLPANIQQTLEICPHGGIYQQWLFEEQTGSKSANNIKSIQKPTNIDYYLNYI